MGLAFSHGGASWAYSSFNEFRKRLARDAIGVDLDEMQGFGGCGEWSDYDDPIVFLLNHSDCDGRLSVEACRAAAPRLRELVSAWEEDDDHRTRGLMLADGMDEAAAAGEPLLFC